jgi:enoyl-CoA hydratase/carnithine racemase
MTAASESSALILKIEPPLAWLTISRPSRRNAMSLEMWRDLPRLCSDIEARNDVRAVIVEGAGGHFCAGADISEFDSIFATVEGARQYLGAIESGLTALSRLDRPSLARIEGSAFGGGLALALACDFRVAADLATFSIPPAKLGLLYGPVETQLLVEAVGPAAAKDLLFSSRVLDAKEAATLGLVNRCVATKDLADSARAQAFAWTKLSQSSIRGAKKAVRAALDADTQTLRALVESAALGEDFREGRTAFREKRPPRFDS